MKQYKHYLKKFIFEQKCIPWWILKRYIRSKIIFNFWYSFLCNVNKLKEIGLTFFKFVIFSLTFLIDFKFWEYFTRKKRDASSLIPRERFGGWLDNYNGLLVYIIVRLTRPSIVVETGVGPGGTSAFILKGLQDNKFGELYSIDLPGNDAQEYPKIGKFCHIHIPEGFKAGWLVPPHLTKRWYLIIGDSKKELPLLMKKLGLIDIFLHDSLHTDEHILFEFNTVLPFLRKKGILLCDDVGDYWSRGFEVFCKNQFLKYNILLERVGIARVT